MGAVSHRGTGRGKVRHCYTLSRWHLEFFLLSSARCNKLTSLPFQSLKKCITNHRQVCICSGFFLIWQMACNWLDFRLQALLQISLSLPVGFFLCLDQFLLKQCTTALGTGSLEALILYLPASYCFHWSRTLPLHFEWPKIHQIQWLSEVRWVMGENEVYITEINNIDTEVWNKIVSDYHLLTFLFRRN